MNFIPNEIYHIYNRGNNKNLVFFEERNYTYFLTKIQRELYRYCDILAYCLMPNHYHLLVYIKETEEKTFLNNHPLIRKIGSLQSSYTRAIQKQNNSVGSIFQQKAKAKITNDSTNNYSLACFHYIHQNPLKANLVVQLENYKYSSFNEYLYLKPSYCNIERSRELGLFDEVNFYKESYEIINENVYNFL